MLFRSWNGGRYALEAPEDGAAIVNPTTDAAVTGVTSSRWSIWGRDKSPEDVGPDVVPPFTVEEGD